MRKYPVQRRTALPHVPGVQQKGRGQDTLTCRTATEPETLATNRRTALAPLPPPRATASFRVPGPFKSTKTVFLIRHGESQWNAAQTAGALHRMMAYDHPLNALGRDQSMGLSRAWKSTLEQARGSGVADSYLDAFVGAHVVYCSPLTRAVQTCVLALDGHPTVKDQGIKLLSAAREIKKRGGLDTVGKVSGKRIAQRVSEKLCELVPTQEVVYLPLAQPFPTPPPPPRNTLPPTVCTPPHTPHGMPYRDSHTNWFWWGWGWGWGEGVWLRLSVHAHPTFLCL